MTSTHLEAASADSAPAASAEITAPLSFAQRGLWIYHEVQPDSPAYNIKSAYAIRGDLDLDALRSSFDELVRRHEALRTTFDVRDGEPVQVIAAAQSVSLPVIDLSTTDGQRDAVLTQRIVEFGRVPFDLRAGPLMRAALFRLAPLEHVLVYVIHHIVFDDGAVPTFSRELQELYRARRRGIRAELDDVPLAFADFAEWQNERMDSGAFATALAYWRTQLAGAPPRLELPLDRPRPPVARANGAVVSALLTPSLAAGVRALSRERGATLFMTLLAAFKVLLYRYTGQRDIIVGSPAANRTRIELEGIVGLFTNVLALRTQLSGESTFADVLRSVRDCAIGAYEHQEAPFAQVIAQTKADRRADAMALVNVLFFVRADIGTPLALDDLDVRRFAIPSTTSKFDLSLRVTETRDGLICSLQYDTDIFETSTAERIVAHFGNLLHGIVERPDAPIAQLPMLSPAEFAHIVGELNATDAPYDNDATLAQRFERQVERAPDAIAVVDAEGALTYRELNARANALAHDLRARGVGRGDVIGLCMDRSISMVMGTLAIVKAGGAYLPLDAQYPADRLAYMVSNSGARIVIARRDARSVAAGLDGVTVLDVEDPAYRDGNAENPPSITTPDDLVYIIYTSGSTGRPKGVPIPGRGVSRLVIGTNYITFEPNDIVAQVCNYSFDVTTFEVWGALLNGARLVVLANEVILDPAAFAAALPAHDINVLFLTGALFRYMASAVPAAFAQLRALVVGGEAIDPAAARAVLTAGAPHRLINGYGPTEATTFACTYDIRLPVPEPIPIGRPIANTQAFVLDRDRNIVPPGVTGELYLGGPGLARGYLNEPELTARKFIAHPFSDVPGDRLYATGDVARLLADGNIEYLGRADRQVKVRGFRIEIDEIETALKAVHGVRDAVVDVRLDSFGEKRIIAFVIAGNGAPTSLEAWHQSLRATLPGYMLPSAVVPVAEFPRTANGKLDIAALTAPDIRGETASRLVLARPELYQLIGLWSDLLGVQTIAPADNFFEIGGHSLLAARMLAQVRAIFGRSVPLAAFFANPTLENLAGLLSASAAEPDAAESKLVEIRAEGSRVPFFLLHGDLAGGGYYARKLVRGLAPDQPFFVLMPHGLGGAHVPTHFEAMARDYAAEILARFPTGPYIVGGYCFGGIVAVEVARILRAANATVCHVVLLDAPTSNARGTTVAEGLDRVARALRVNEGRRDALRDGVGLTVNLAERIAARLRKLRDRIDVSRRGFRLKPPITQIARDDEDPLLRPLYVVAQRYVQRRYAGPITLIVPADERPYRLQAIADWKAVAPQVSVDFVPGEHLTCVTTYVDETAACINAVLERSQPTRLE